jgi:SAM-dependent methyltransferase
LSAIAQRLPSRSARYALQTPDPLGLSQGMTASHLEFYTKFQISPVRQDIGDLAKHFQRREALYRQLGILPRFVGGRRVLEVGPGGGYNSLYTASLGPSRYVLVEGNPTGIEHMKALFAQFPDWSDMTKIVPSKLEDWTPDDQYDFVFCEGLLSGVPNPEEILNKLSAATAKGGVLTITCVDHLSHFPETLRRAFAQLAIDPKDSLETQVQKILPMMEPHLTSLPGMSRRHDDWVIDNLIHPGSIIPLINFPEAVAVLATRFEFYASSPHIVTDWRWYKSIVGDDWSFNIPAVEQYWSLAHNMLDYRAVLPPRPPKANEHLYDLCTKAREQLEIFERRRNPVFLQNFRTFLDEIITDVSDFSDVAADALAEAAAILATEPFDPQAVARAKKFGAFFGRGQQYISLTRIH